MKLIHIQIIMATTIIPTYISIIMFLLFMERAERIELSSLAWKAKVIYHYTIPALVEVTGVEPAASAVQVQRSPIELHPLYMAV